MSNARRIGPPPVVRACQRDGCGRPFRTDPDEPDRYCPHCRLNVREALQRAGYLARDAEPQARRQDRAGRYHGGDSGFENAVRAIEDGGN
jgi:hypothetical protein